MLVLLGSIVIAAAQSPSGTNTHNANGKPQLTPTQKSAITRGLSNQSPQSSDAAAQTQPGSKIAELVDRSVHAKDVGDQVPGAKSYLFVKLPDRVLLIDPDSQVVAQILLDTDAAVLLVTATLATAGCVSYQATVCARAVLNCSGLPMTSAPAWHETPELLVARYSSWGCAAV